jgi:hypothetical protein
VREGDIPNHGRKHAPRVRISECPHKVDRCHSPPVRYKLYGATGTRHNGRKARSNP